LQPPTAKALDGGALKTENKREKKAINAGNFLSVSMVIFYETIE
jgi:hypothetical protein